LGGGYTRRWLPDLPKAALPTLAWVARVCRRWWGCLRGSPAALPARLSSRVTVWRSRGREYAGLACHHSYRLAMLAVVSETGWQAVSDTGMMR
jgi:hypothetical protein